MTPKDVLVFFAKVTLVLAVLLETIALLGNADSGTLLFGLIFAPLAFAGWFHLLGPVILLGAVAMAALAGGDFKTTARRYIANASWLILALLGLSVAWIWVLSRGFH